MIVKKIMLIHALINIKSKIPFLNSNNTYKKNISKNIISNLKLLFFIPEKDKEEFDNSIKRKYNSKSYLKFYNYFDKFVYKKIYGKQFLCNYWKLINNNEINENNYFVTNNFVERINKTLSENLLYKKSSFINFRNSILSTDLYFENKNGYKLNNRNLSKAIIYYIKNWEYKDKKNNIKLIDLHKLKSIYNAYVE